MSEFTKEEISLCKQVAERHRKQIKKGAWIIQEERADIPLLVIDTQGASVILNVGYETKTEAHYGHCVLLWTISDCLEFFKKKKFIKITIEIRREDTEIYGYYTDETGRLPRRVGKTSLEACLRAVLAVLEESK